VVGASRLGGLVAAMALAWLVGAPGSAHATPNDLARFKTRYAVGVGARLDDCHVCHGAGGSLNPYGLDYKIAGKNEAALAAIETTDSDGDSWWNLVEIASLFFPGRGDDHPAGVALTPAVAARSGQPGASLVYQLEVTHIAGVTAHYTLVADVTAGGAWPVSGPASVELGPGATATVELQVEIPAGATPGQTSTARVTVTSDTDPGETASSTLTTTASSAPMPPGVALSLGAKNGAGTPDTAFGWGEVMRVDLTVSNAGSGRLVDVFFGVLLPAAPGPGSGCPAGDPIVFLADDFARTVSGCASSPPQTFVPLIRRASLPGPLSPLTVPGFFQVTWPAGVAPGSYTMFLLLTEPDAFEDGRVDPGDVVGLGMVSVTVGP
jgi:hypothetical protein